MAKKAKKEKSRIEETTGSTLKELVVEVSEGKRVVGKVTATTTLKMLKNLICRKFNHRLAVANTKQRKAHSAWQDQMRVVEEILRKSAARYFGKAMDEAKKGQRREHFSVDYQPENKAIPCGDYIQISHTVTYQVSPEQLATTGKLAVAVAEARRHWREHMEGLADQEALEPYLHWSNGDYEMDPRLVEGMITAEVIEGTHTGRSLLQVFDQILTDETGVTFGTAKPVV